MSECECACHGTGPYGACDVEGGCGSVGCSYADGALREEAHHRCGRGDGCKGRTPVRDEKGNITGVWLAQQISTARGLCDRCTADVVHVLNHLTGDVVELTMHLGRTGATGDVLVSASKEPPIPIRVSLEALRSEIDSELQAWAEPVAEALGIEWDTAAMHRSRLAPRVQRAARLLSASVDTFLALPEVEHPAWENGEPVWDHEFNCQDVTLRDGIDGALHLVELHRRAYSALGRAEYVVRLPQRCPWCNWIALVRRNGQDNVECEHCHKIVRRELLDWLAHELVKAEQARQAAEEIPEIEDAVA